MSAVHEARVYRWSDLPTDHPMERIDRQRIIGEHAMLSRVTLHEGFELAMHHHDNEQLAIVLAGCVRFTIGDGEQVDVRAGEVLHLPPNVPHAARAMERSVVLDVFSPPSAGTGVDRR